MLRIWPHALSPNTHGKLIKPIFWVFKCSLSHFLLEFHLALWQWFLVWGYFCFHQGTYTFLAVKVQEVAPDTRTTARQLKLHTAALRSTDLADSSISWVKITRACFKPLFVVAVVLYTVVCSALLLEGRCVLEEAFQRGQLLSFTPS